MGQPRTQTQEARAAPFSRAAFSRYATSRGQRLHAMTSWLSTFSQDIASQLHHINRPEAVRNKRFVTMRYEHLASRSHVRRITSPWTLAV